jgi:nucleotide-binding universal stress UspA family protein
MQAKQNLAYILAAVIALAFMWLIKPSIHYSPKGIALPIQAAAHSPTHSSDINVLPPWTSYQKKLAWINVEYHSLKPSKPEAKKALDKALQLAKSQGANGLVILGVGYQPPSAIPELAMYVLRAVAVVK